LTRAHPVLPFTPVTDAGKLRIFDSGQEIFPNIHIGTYASAPASASLVFDTNAILWNDQPDNAEYDFLVVVHYEDHAFDVAANLLTFTGAVTNPLPPTMVTTVSNSALTAFEMQCYTVFIPPLASSQTFYSAWDIGAFDGTASDAVFPVIDAGFALHTPLDNAEKAIVTVNGRQISPTYDYSLSLDGSRIIIHRYLAEGDFVVITSLSGNVADADFRSRQASRLSANSMMGENAMIGNWDETAFDSGSTDTLVRGQTYRMETYDAIERSRLGLYLTQPLARDATEIFVGTLSSKAPSIYKTRLVKPQGAPGVIWIGDERIEFFEIETTGGDHVLRQLRRGTRGTSQGAEQRTSRFFAASGDTVFTMPALDGGAVTILHWLQEDETVSEWDEGFFDSEGLDDIITRQVFTGANQALGAITHYDVGVVGSDLVVTFVDPPAHPFVVHQRASSTYGVGTPVEPLSLSPILFDKLSENK
jgi:hypothetical protein